MDIELLYISELKFPGSPTLRINGEDIEIGADGMDNYAVGCRIYQEEGKPSGVPSKEMIRQALWRAVEPKFLPGCC